MGEKSREEYWRRNVRLVTICLIIWFLVSCGFGIILVHLLNTISIGGYKLGFWFAQQGSNGEGLKEAESFGWKGNEMTKVDRDIMVLANPEIAGPPNWVIALVIAGAIAAALSTAAGLLLAIATAVSHDVLKGWLMPNISDQQISVSH